MATILVVEDYAVTQRVLSLNLRNNGHQVIIAEDGLKALEKLKTTIVDLAIVDIAMPEMDGLDLLRALRRDPQFKSLPVVMLSASGQDDDRQTALALGANAFLSKPVKSDQLIEAISQWI